MGLSTTATYPRSRPFALYDSGADGPAWCLYWPWPLRAYPRTLSLLGLLVATMDSLVTDFTGVAGVGELYGLPRSLTLPLTASALLAIVASGAHRRAKRAAIATGLSLLPFLAIGWIARPDFEALAAELIDLPLGDHK